MARLILHIGTHKTATTMIQNTLFENRDVLSKHGIIYPAIGGHTGHHGLLTDWLALPAAYELPEGGLGTLRILAEKYAQTDKTLLLSSEEFSRGGGAGGSVDMAALRAAFDGFDSISVLCVLREQWQFLQSVYLEIARQRIPERPLMLVETALETGTVDGLWCDYERLYDHLLSGFRQNEITFLDYETSRMKDSGILGAILALTNLPVESLSLREVNSNKSNISPRALPRWAGLTIAGGHTKNPDIFSAIETAFDLEFGENCKTCLFTRSELEALSDHFKPRNATLAKRIAKQQPGFLISSTFPGHNTVHREDIAAPFWLRAARRIYYQKSGS